MGRNQWITEIAHYLVQLLPIWLEWLSFLVWPIFIIASLLLVFFSFSVIANFLAAPFNSLLAETTEQYLTGKNNPGRLETDYKRHTPLSLGRTAQTVLLSATYNSAGNPLPDPRD